MTEVKRRAWELVAEGYLSLGQLGDALAVFERAGHRAGLVACGNKALERGWLDTALTAFARAGAEEPREGLLACGNVALERGRVDDALAAFKAVAAPEMSSVLKQ